MNLRDLKYLIAVAETKHFGQAAKRCFVSQPTLSAQIKKMEAFLGVVLFERTNRSVSITPVGQEILVYARRALEQVDNIVMVAESQTSPMVGRLSIGSIYTLSPSLLPLILSPLRQTYPKLRLSIKEATTDTLLKDLQEHSLDAILLATQETDAKLAEIPLFDEPFWLAHPSDHPIYTKEHITQADLAKLELLLLSEGHCLSQQVSQVCQQSALSKEDEFSDLRASSLETLIQLVGAGFGCTLVPALALRGSWTTDAGVIARQLEIKEAFRRIRLVYRKGFPRQQSLVCLAQIIQQNLPNTVKLLH